MNTTIKVSIFSYIHIQQLVETLVFALQLLLETVDFAPELALFNPQIRRHLTKVSQLFGQRFGIASADNVLFPMVMEQSEQ